MKKIYYFVVAFCSFFLIIFSLSNNKNKDLIKIGVTAGPHAQIMKFIKEKNDIPIEIIEFNDFVLPNIALNDGNIDVNCYQHKPYMENENKEKNLNLIDAGKTILLPIGIYSKKIKNLSDLKKDSLVLIPNDPTNGSRALLLLEKAGLIKIDPNNVSIHSIKNNFKNLKIKEIDAPMLSRSLDDCSIAVINTDWIITSKTPMNLQIFREDINSPYANILVATKETLKKAEIIRKAYQSDDVKKFIIESFSGSIIPAW